ncbi:MAG: class I SAM-dependent methyltransferase [Gemmatimonadales bacterium]
MTSMQYYRDLLAQTERIEAFQSAIAGGVRPGDSVLDVGTGLGTFAFFAADAGAAQVWGVDGDPIVHVARTIGLANGYDDRVRFLRGWLPDLEVPGRPNVVILEDFPPRLLDAPLVRILGHVQQKIAAPGARYVPASATICLAPLAGSKSSWACLGDADRKYAIDWSPTREYAVNSVHHCPIDPAMLAAPAVTIAKIDFNRSLTVDSLGGRATWDLEGGNEIDGLVYWFDMELGDGITLSNAPGASPASWGHCLLPIDPPLRFAEPGVLSATAGPEWSNGEPGWFRWSAAVGSNEREGHEFRGFPASAADLVGLSPDAVPRLNRDGQAAARTLELADGTRPIRAIAEGLREDVDPTLRQRDAERLAARVLVGKIENGYLPETYQ